MGERVVVEYKTKIDYCRCCSQKLPETKLSDYKYFNLTKENFFEWSEDWDEIAKYDDLPDAVREFVYETIDFFATSSHESVIIDKSQFEKVNQFVLSEVLEK